MQRIGIMGGTFNPIHTGHLLSATIAADALALNQVIFVPTGDSWHKPPNIDSTTASHRYAMVHLATTADPRFVASRVDIDRPGPTYTVDTLRDLQPEHNPTTLWYIIVGADALTTFPTWRHHDEILARAHLIAIPRPGHPLTIPDIPPATITVLPTTASLNISSTDIRAQAAAGNPLTGLVPPAIEAYITNHNLYRTKH